MCLLLAGKHRWFGGVHPTSITKEQVSWDNHRVVCLCLLVFLVRQRPLETEFGPEFLEITIFWGDADYIDMLDA